MSKAVSMMIFDGTFQGFEPVRKFVGDLNLKVVKLDHDPMWSVLVIKSGEKDVEIWAGDSIVRKADGILSRRKKRKVRGFAE